MQIPGKFIGINLSLIILSAGDRMKTEINAAMRSKRKDKICGARNSLKNQRYGFIYQIWHCPDDS
jgi:hypothetical protein